MTSGVYPFPEEGPQIPGGEAAGFVSALGEGVSEFDIGDRVAYTTPNGAYREERVMPADRLKSGCLMMSVMRLPPLPC